MGKKTSLEKEIDWLRTVITLIVAAIFGIFAWIAHNYKTGEQIEIVVASLLLFLFVNSTLLINRRVYKILKELEGQEN